MNTLASVVKLMRSSVRIDCDVKVECARRNQRTRKQQLLDISIHYRVTCNALFMNESWFCHSCRVKSDAVRSVGVLVIHTCQLFRNTAVVS